MDHIDAQLGQEATPEGEGVENQKPENNINMASLLEQEGVDIDFPKHGEIRQGVIASISQGQILVSIGAKSEGIIKGKEFEVISSEDSTWEPGTFIQSSPGSHGLADSRRSAGL
jgi:small subunit ribosomal protein S1